MVGLKLGLDDVVGADGDDHHHPAETVGEDRGGTGSWHTRTHGAPAVELADEKELRTADVEVGRQER